MLPRALPSYLSVAYSFKFEKEPSKNTFTKISRYFQILKEVFFYHPNPVSFRDDKCRLTTYFDNINKETTEQEPSRRPLCVYFVSSNDHNGGMFGEPKLYCHIHQIKEIKKHFDVVAYVVDSEEQMFEKLQELKTANRDIKVVNINAHGDQSSVVLERDWLGTTSDAFKNCSEDAVIILNSCSTGKGKHSIAEKIALNNPGKTVFAPKHTFIYSQLVFVKQKIDHVIYKSCLWNLFTGSTCKEFKCPGEDSNLHT